jgi:MFS family permease
MQSAAGLGAVCGAIYIASARNSTRFVFRMMVGIVCFGACLLVFAASPILPIAIVALLGVGFSMQTYNTSNNTMLQMNVDPEYRGRVLSTLFIQRGLVPLGTVVAGIAMSFIGPRLTMGIMASAVILLGVLSGPYVLRVLSSIDGGPVFTKDEEAVAESRTEGRRAAEAS